MRLKKNYNCSQREQLEKMERETERSRAPTGLKDRRKCVRRNTRTVQPLPSTARETDGAEGDGREISMRARDRRSRACLITRGDVNESPRRRFAVRGLRGGSGGLTRVLLSRVPFGRARDCRDQERPVARATTVNHRASDDDERVPCITINCHSHFDCGRRRPRGRGNERERVVITRAGKSRRREGEVMD